MGPQQMVLAVKADLPGEHRFASRTRSGGTAGPPGNALMAGPKQQLIAELASRVGNLGIEVADIAGHLDEVTTRVSQQSMQFKQLRAAAETMVAGNREIDRAARGTQGAASSAGAEITESRALIGGAVQHIGQLTSAVARIEERLGSFSQLLKQI